VTVNRSFEDLAVKCERESFEPGLLSVKSSTKGMAFGNIIFGGIIGAGVDMSTGAAYDYPTLVTVSITKAAGAPHPQAAQTGSQKAEAGTPNSAIAPITVGAPAVATVLTVRRAEFRVTDGFTTASRSVEVSGRDIQKGVLPGGGDFSAFMPPGGWVPANAESLGRWSRTFVAGDGQPGSSADLSGQAAPRMTLNTPTGSRQVVLVNYEGWANRSVGYGDLVVSHKAPFKLWHSSELGIPVRFESIITAPGNHKRESRETLELVALE